MCLCGISVGYFFWRRKKNEQLSSSNRITFFWAGKLKNVWLLCLYLVVEYPGQGEGEARRPHDGDGAEGAGHLGLAGDAQWVADGEVPGGEKRSYNVQGSSFVIPDENTGNFAQS